MTPGERMQDLELKIQHLTALIEPAWLAPQPFPDEPDLRKAVALVKTLRLVSKTAEHQADRLDRDFMRQKRYGFELILIIGASWYLLGKVVMVPTIAALVVSVFLGLLFFWFLISEERRQYDRAHRREQAERHLAEFDLIALSLEKQQLELELGIPELTEAVVDEWIENNRLWHLHANERAALNEWKRELNELRRRLNESENR